LWRVAVLVETKKGQASSDFPAHIGKPASGGTLFAGFKGLGRRLWRAAVAGFGHERLLPE
jgi:hypothetical protein